MGRESARKPENRARSNSRFLFEPIRAAALDLADCGANYSRAEMGQCQPFMTDKPVYSYEAGQDVFGTDWRDWGVNLTQENAAQMAGNQQPKISRCCFILLQGLDYR